MIDASNAMMAWCVVLENSCKMSLFFTVLLLFSDAVNYR